MGKLRAISNGWADMTGTRDPRRALRAIAVFEASKGLVALVGLIGAIDLLHRDVRALAMTLIGRFGLDPQAHYPSLLLHYAELLPETHVQSLLMLGSAYIALRLLEATGLWLGKAWGEYLGALSGSIYIPFEWLHWMHESSVMNACIVVLNAGIVGYLCFALWLRHQH